MIWRLCFKLYIFVYNLFAAIGAFHIHIMFHCDRINNGWSKVRMLAHHLQGNWISSAHERFIESKRYLYLASITIFILNLKRESNLLIISGNSYLVKLRSNK